MEIIEEVKEVKMDTKIIKKVFKYVLVILWMMIIYKFSSDAADISNSKSSLVIEMIAFIGVDVNSIFGELAMLVVRKLGHFTEYFILCMLLINSFYKDMTLRGNYKLSLLISFLYACSDEFHQLFVPGRSGQIVDVFIDTIGALLGIFIWNILIIRKSKKGEA